MNGVTAALETLRQRQTRAENSAVSPEVYGRNGNSAVDAQHYQRTIETEAEELRPHQVRAGLEAMIESEPVSACGLVSAQRVAQRVVG